MEILGIGMPELIFIFIIAILVMGPKDMQKAGKTIGKWLRDIVTSDGWKMFQQTSRELRTLPNRLMREANEDLEQVNKIGKEMKSTFDQTPGQKFSPPGGSITINTPMSDIKPEESRSPKENESESEQNA